MAHRAPPAGSASPSFSPFNNNSPIPPPPPPHPPLQQLHHHPQQHQQHRQQQHYARSPVAHGSPLSPYQAGLSPVGQHHQQQAVPSPPMATMRGASGRVVEYNPQQWGQGGPTGVAISHAALAGAGGAPRDADVGW
jgi:hypothetical protein